MQSISSKRLDSGWSKRERGSGATVSRQMNVRPGVVGGDAEDQRVGVVARRHAAEGDHRDLLGDRRHGAEHLRPAHDDAVARLPHPPQVQERVLLLRRGLGPVDLRIDQHVREEQVALAHVLVVAGGVLAEARARRARTGRP